MMKNFLNFSGKLIVVHVVTYYTIGALAYRLITWRFYTGLKSVFSSFMVMQTDPVLWPKVMIWILPGQILRGLLMAVALYPFFDILCKWKYLKRWIVIAGIYIIFGFWASCVAAPGTIDGMIYMRPEITSEVHLLVQPEIILQGLLLSAWIAKWMKPKGYEN
jgi:hypothetical protein